MSGKYALIIGNTEYIDAGLAQLSAPGKDTEDFARILKAQDIGAFDEVNILLNQLSSTISESIDEFFHERKPDDLLVLYFSGHGVRDELGALYLAVRNTIRTRLRSTAVKSDYIREAMDQSRSKRQVVILDCCNSGAFPQGVKAELGGVMGMTMAFQGYGRYVLTASDATQFAWEGDQMIGETQNSLFTHFLIKGLQGEADSDGDGKITVDELYDYTYEQISRVTPKQTPTKSASKQEGEIILRQNIRIEDTKPIPLSNDLLTAINNSLPFIREGAVSQLELLLKGKNLSLARSARLALERIVAEDDSRRVVQAAKKALESVPQKDQSSPFSRTAQLRREKNEQAEKFKAEQEKLLREKTELEKRLEDERITHEKEKVEARRKAETAQLPAAQKTMEVQPARGRIEAQPRSTKLRWLLIGMVGLVSITIIVLGGYAILTLLPLSIRSTSTQAQTEEVSAPSEAPILTQAPTEEVFTPTEEPTESITATVNVPQPEITDSLGAVLVLVPAGDFPMGSSDGAADEKPIHTVYLDAYYIDKFEVTNKLYAACVDAGACNPPIHTGSFTRSSYYGNTQYDEYPVVYVNWNMANTYCKWRGARLPTEAQWEKAARGTDARIYPWGGKADCQKANYQGSGNGCVGGTSEVSNYEAGKSPYGAYDMAGNVWEWVADWYSEAYYKTSLPSNPFGPDSGLSKVLRGGSWSRSEYTIRATTRHGYASNYYNFDIGFRCASSLP